MLPRRHVPSLAAVIALGAAVPACFLDASSLSGGAAGPGGAGGEMVGPGGGGSGGTAGGGGTGGATAGGGAGGAGGSGAGGAGGSGGDETGEGCPGKPIYLSPYSNVQLQGNTTKAMDDGGASCGGSGAPDLVYAVIPKAGGTLTVSLDPSPPYMGIVHVRTTCGDAVSQEGCGSTSLNVPVEKDEPLFVFVDGAGNKPSGAFSLGLALDGCGNGELEPDHEECDDGNQLGGDGCSPGCEVECACPAGTNCSAFEDAATHRCYALVKSPDLAWDAASMACILWGGTLAVLATTGEIGAVKPALPDGDGDMWIGATDLVQEGKWAWQNGEDFTYSKGSSPWKEYVIWPDEPNGGTNENCLEIYEGGELNDQGCDAAQDYLCERAPAGAEP